MNGFSLHANADVAAHRRDQFDRLLRYTARVVVSLERLTQDTGPLHIISAITQEKVTTRILRHLNLASEPPAITPARYRQEVFAFDEVPVTVGE